MIGSGYVGLVSGVCFADSDHDVVCVDLRNVYSHNEMKQPGLVCSSIGRVG